MDIEIAKLLIQIFGTLGTGAIISGIVNRKITKIEKKKEEEIQKKLDEECEFRDKILTLIQSNKVLLRHVIFRIYNNCKETKTISYSDRQQLDEAYECYHKCHGNSIASDRYHWIVENCEIVD